MRNIFFVATLCAAAVPAMVAQQPAGQSRTATPAKPGAVRVLVSNGMRAPLDAVTAQAERTIGHPLAIEYGTSQGLQSAMASGQGFEVAIVTAEVLDEMTKAGKIVPGSRTDLGRVPVAVGQRGDAPKADVSTPAAIKRTLLGAKSVRWTTTGASMPTIARMLTGLGIERELAAKLNLPRDQVSLGPGEYEINLNLASEVLPRATPVYLGTIPEEFQVPAIMSAGIGTGANRPAADALMAFLRGPALEPELKAVGIRAAVIAQAPGTPPRGPAPFRTHTIKEGKIYWVEGGGGNSGVIIGDTGVIVVDAKTTVAGAKQLQAEIAKLTPKPISHVILTHSDGDHVNGIEAFPADVKIVAHYNNRVEQRATHIYASVEVDGGRCLPPLNRLPTHVVLKDEVKTKIDGINLTLRHPGPAHTSGDLIVYLPDEKVAFVGDLITNVVLVHYTKNGSLDGWFRAAKAMLALGADTFVGGHSAATDTTTSLQKRMADYQALRDKVGALANEGKSLAEVKAAMGDPPQNPVGCRGMPFWSVAEIAYHAHMDRVQEFK